MNKLRNLPEINVAKPREENKKKGFLSLFFPAGAGGSGGVLAANSTGILVAFAVTCLGVGSSLVSTYVRGHSPALRSPAAALAAGRSAGTAGKKSSAAGEASASASAGGAGEAGSAEAPVPAAAVTAEKEAAAEPRDGDAASQPAPEGNASAESPSYGQPVPGAAGWRKLGERTNSFTAGSFRTGGGNFSGNFGNASASGAVASGGGVLGAFQRPAVERSKLLAMKSAVRQTAVRGGVNRGVPGVKNAYAQAKGIGAQMKYSGTVAESQRGTAEKAWEGMTGKGQSTGGGGISAPVPGTGGVNSPSFDTKYEPGQTETETPKSPVLASKPVDVSPWAALAGQAAALLAAASVMIGFISLLKLPPTYAAAAKLALIVAGVISVYVVQIGIRIASEYGQSLLGTMYTAAGAAAAGAALLALTGFPGIAQALLAVSGLVQMAAGFTGGK